MAMTDDDRMLRAFDTAYGTWNETKDSSGFETEQRMRLKSLVADCIQKEFNRQVGTFPPFIVAKCILATTRIKALYHHDHIANNTRVDLYADIDGEIGSHSAYLRKYALQFNASLSPDELTSVFNCLKAFAPSEFE